MNLIKADFYRIFRSAAFWVVFLLMSFCAIAFVWISYAMQNGILGYEASSSAAGLMDTMMITIMGPVLAASFICSDFQNKTIHSQVLYGKGRQTIVWAKMVPYAGMTFLILMPYSIAALIGFVSGAKFSIPFSKSVDSAYMIILANETGVTVSPATIEKLIVLLLVIALVHISRLSVCVLLSYWLKNPVAVIGVGIFTELMLSLLALAFMGSDILTKLISWTPFISMQQNFSMETTYSKLIKIVFVCLVFMTVMLKLTGLVFKKTEIK
jgi:ABC-2 type transport system permease protein